MAPGGVVNKKNEYNIKEIRSNNDNKIRYNNKTKCNDVNKDKMKIKLS